MTTAVVSAVVPRIQYVAAASQTVFTVPFGYYAETDLQVFQYPQGGTPDDAAQILQYNIDYTVSSPSLTGGTITLTTGATVNDNITITRAMPNDRQNYYIAGYVSPDALNNDFDKLVLMTQQNSMAISSVIPAYNLDAVVLPADQVLPQLAPNSIWKKNNDNTAIVAADIGPFPVSAVNNSDGVAGHIVVWSGVQRISDPTHIVVNSSSDMSGIRNIAATGTASISGNTSISGTLNVSGQANLLNGAVISNGMAVFGSATFNNQLTVRGDAHFQAEAEFDENANFEKSVFVGDLLNTVTASIRNGIIGNLSTDFYEGDPDISTVGTITQGIWHANVIDVLYGGTGASTKTQGFNNLSPLTSKGQLIGFNGVNNVIVPVSPISGYVLSYDPAQPTGFRWIPSSGGGGGGGSVTAVGTTSDLTVDGIVGQTITTSGTLGLAGTGVTPQTYDMSTNVYTQTIDSRGRIRSMDPVLIDGNAATPLILQNSFSEFNDGPDGADPAAARENLGVKISSSSLASGDVMGWTQGYANVLEGLDNSQSFLDSGFLTKFPGTIPSAPYVYFLRGFEGSVEGINVANSNGNTGNPTFSLNSTINIDAISNGIGGVVVEFIGRQTLGSHIQMINGDDSDPPKLMVRDGIYPDIDLDILTQRLGGLRIGTSGLGDRYPGRVRLMNADFTEAVTVTSQDVSSSWTYAYPASGPSSAEQTLITTDTPGNMEWASPLLKTGGTITGPILYSGAPMDASELVNKSYVDSVAIGTEPHAAAVAASTAPYTATYYNGPANDGIGATLTNADTQAPFVGDGLTLSIGDRFLFKDQTNAAENGIYVILDEGSISTNWIAERAADFNADAVGNIQKNALLPISSGNTLSGSSWLMTSDGPFTVGTTDIIWDIFTPPLGIIGVDGVTVAGSVISLTDVGVGDTTSFPSSITINNKGQITGYGTTVIPLEKSMNLADLPDTPLSRQNLGLEIGVDVQAQNQRLQAVASNVDSPGGIMVMEASGPTTHSRSITSSNSTLGVVNGNGISGNMDIIIPNNTIDTLGAFTGTSGKFQPLPIDTTLRIYDAGGGVKKLGSVSGDPRWRLIAEVTTSGVPNFVDFDTATYPAMNSYSGLYIAFYNVRAEISSSRNLQIVFYTSGAYQTPINIDTLFSPADGTALYGAVDLYPFVLASTPTVPVMRELKFRSSNIVNSHGNYVQLSFPVYGGPSFGILSTNVIERIRFQVQDIASRISNGSVFSLYGYN